MNLDVIRVHFGDDWLTLVRLSEYLWIDVGEVREALRIDENRHGRRFHQEPRAEAKTASAPGADGSVCDRLVIEMETFPAWLANILLGMLWRERATKLARYQCGRARGLQAHYWAGSVLPTASAGPMLLRSLAEVARRLGLLSAISDLLARMTGQIERLCRRQEDHEQRLAQLERPAAEEHVGGFGSEPLTGCRQRRKP